MKQKPTRAPTIQGRAKKKLFLRRQTVPLGRTLSPVAAPHPITDTHPFIRQVGDKCGWLASFIASSHAELGLSPPGNAEPQLGECSQHSAKAT